MGFMAGQLCVVASNRALRPLSLPGPLLLPRARAGLQELLARPQHLLRNTVRSLQGGLGAAEGGILGLLHGDPTLMTPPSIVDAPASSAGLIFHHPALLLSISRGLIVVSSNDSYYLHPLGTPEPGQHVILRAEHLPISGGTCAHGDDLGSTVGAIARLFRPLERRVKPAPGPSCASAPSLNVCCCPGWAAQGVSAWAGDPKESLGCGVGLVLRWVGWDKGDMGRLCCNSPNWPRFPSQLSILGGSVVSGEPTSPPGCPPLRSSEPCCLLCRRREMPGGP